MRLSLLSSFHFACR